MDIKIIPGTLSGTLQAIPSKSELHRMLICAAFADKETELYVSGSAYDGKHPLPNDILATVSCLEALGAKCEAVPGLIRVTPVSREVPVIEPLLDCGESGSTLRFLLPVAAAAAERPSFTGKGRLPERPISGLTDTLKSHGAAMSSERLPFTVSGKLTGGTYEIPGDVSSQYLTGLLLTLPLLDEDAEIRLTTPLRSGAYIDITLDVMKSFGVNVLRTGSCYRIGENKRYRSPRKMNAGGDWSNMAAFLTSSAIHSGNAVRCENLDRSSCQGDRKILELLECFGAAVESDEDSVSVRHAELHGASIDIDETPDLLPVLAVAACAASGETVFYNAARLRLKESDRIETTADMVRALGGTAETEPDRLVIRGTGTLRGGSVDAANDHRIVMAAAIASSLCTEPVVIRGAEAVNKSYPTFFEDFQSLKGAVYVL